MEKEVLRENIDEHLKKTEPLVSIIQDCRSKCPTKNAIIIKKDSFFLPETLKDIFYNECHGMWQVTLFESGTITVLCSLYDDEEWGM